MKPTRVIRVLKAGDLNQLMPWWSKGIPFVDPPDQQWLDYILANDQVHVFCLCPSPKSLDHVLAYVQFDIEAGDAWLAIVTDPQHQRRGFASELLLMTAARLPALGAHRIVAAVAVGNRASQRFFQKMGFQQLSQTNAICVEPDLVYLVRCLDAVSDDRN